jgi:hypothetical protein
MLIEGLLARRKTYWLGDLAVDTSHGCMAGRQASAYEYAIQILD